MQEEYLSNQKPKLSRSYESDLAKSLHVSEAEAVQTLLEKNREREEELLAEEKMIHQKKSYFFGIIIFITLAILAFGFSWYRIKQLTIHDITLEKKALFLKETNPLSPAKTTKDKFFSLAQTLVPKDSFEPMRIPLLTTDTPPKEFTTTDLFSFTNTAQPSSFIDFFPRFEYGIMMQNTIAHPFVLLTKPSQEKMIDANKSLEEVGPILFSSLLGISESAINEITRQQFSATVIKNLPAKRIVFDDQDKNIELVYMEIPEQNKIIIASKEALLGGLLDALFR